MINNLQLGRPTQRINGQRCSRIYSSIHYSLHAQRAVNIGLGIPWSTEIASAMPVRAAGDGCHPHLEKFDRQIR